MALDFTNLTQCRALALELTGLEAEPSDLEALLQATAGTKGSSTYYRPYYVAARVLDRRLNALESAEGAVFRKLAASVRALDRQQKALDEALGLTLPEGVAVRTAASAALDLEPVY